MRCGAQPRVAFAYSVLVACCFGGSAAGQSFDVALVKISQHALRDHRFDTSANDVTIYTAPLGVCIRWAYGFHLSSRYWLEGPSWLEPGIDEVRYDIVAKTAEPVTTAQLRLMMRSLLAERWKLVAHIASREIPVYVLSVSKSGPRLTISTEEGGGPPSRLPDGVKFVGAGMWQLVEERALQVAAPIADETGLTGRYDFTVGNFMEYSEYAIPILGTRGADFGPAYDQALRKLGLELKMQKRPTNILVVEHVEKTPTGN